MSQIQHPEESNSKPALPKLLGRAAVVVFVEAAAVGAFALYLLWGLLSGQAKLAAAELTLVVLFAAAAVWVWYIGVSLRLGSRWARSAAIFWQTCQLFLASQSFTGRGANVVIGVLLIASSIWVLGNLFNRSVIRDSKDDVESGR